MEGSVGMRPQRQRGQVVPFSKCTFRGSCDNRSRSRHTKQSERCGSRHSCRTPFLHTAPALHTAHNPRCTCCCRCPCTQSHHRQKGKEGTRHGSTWWAACTLPTAAARLRALQPLCAPVITAAARDRTNFSWNSAAVVVAAQIRLTVDADVRSAIEFRYPARADVHTRRTHFTARARREVLELASPSGIFLRGRQPSGLFASTSANARSRRRVPVRARARLGAIAARRAPRDAPLASRSSTITPLTTPLTRRIPSSEGGRVLERCTRVRLRGENTLAPLLTR